MIAKTQAIASKSVLQDFVSAKHVSDLEYFALIIVRFIVKPLSEKTYEVACADCASPVRSFYICSKLGPF